jgi:hypothetical protein
LNLALYFIPLAADKTLGRIHGGFGMQDGLAFGDLSHQPFTIGGKGHDRRGGTAALSVHNHFRSIAFHEGNGGIGRAQIDSNCFSHN